jgi:hypothetical protein
MRKEEQGMLVDITITPQGIPIGENIIAQVHPLEGSIIIGLGWLNCEDK